MALLPLTTNVTSVTLTPYLRIELMPDNHPAWGIVTNNNWIKVDNASKAQAEEISTVRLTVNSSLTTFRGEITTIEGQVQNEAILRSAADAAIVANLNVVRFEGQALGTTETILTHNRGNFVQVVIINEATGYDVTSNYDTFIRHASVNEVGIRVGISGTFTILCIG